MQQIIVCMGRKSSALTALQYNTNDTDAILLQRTFNTLPQDDNTVSIVKRQLLADASAQIIVGVLPNAVL